MNLLDRRHRLLWALSALLILLGSLLVWWSWQAVRPAASEARQPSPDVDPRPVASATALVAVRPTAVVTATRPRTHAVRLAVPGVLPGDIRSGLQTWMQPGPGTAIITDTKPADLALAMEGSGEPLIERVYVPVARFAEVADAVPAASLLALWRSGPGEDEARLAVDEDTAAALALLWGPSDQVEVFPDVAAVGTALWQTPGRLGIVPFDQLVPELKALSINGNDPTDNQFQPDDYPLVLRLFLEVPAGLDSLARDLQDHIVGEGQHTNRDPGKLTTLVMTGVTAMSRTTALRMEQMGYDYPAAVISSTLAAADLTHISNEVPFTPDCQVDATENNLTLCSRPEYLQSMRDVGVDLVGLTGNHLNDFGPEATLWSLQFYQDEALPIYGGGADLEDSWKPLLVEHNGNRLVFLGANSFGPDYALAGPDYPGSTPYTLEAMTEAIASARQELDPDLVLVELQWEESYDTVPLLTQREDFPKLREAGADLVTGVQSHVPQAVGFEDGGLILYGLGNLFFDQMWSQWTREGLIPRHTIYDGRHLSTKLMTTILEDFAQPRWATEEERAAILERVFAASGWWE